MQQQVVDAIDPEIGIESEAVVVVIALLHRRPVHDRELVRGRQVTNRKRFNKPSRLP